MLSYKTPLQLRSSGDRLQRAVANFAVPPCHEGRRFLRQSRWTSVCQQNSPNGQATATEMFYDTKISEFAKKSVNRLSLSQLLEFGQSMNEYKFMKSARYLQAEIPVRIAHRIRDFQNLPFIVACNPYLIEVQNLYLNSFHKLMDLPTISSDEEEVEFTNLLSRLVDEHVHVPDLLGQGVKECRRYITPGELDHFLNRTLRGRIGMRVLAEQHINLKNSRNGFIGIINTRLRPQDIIQRAWLHAQDVCRLHYGDAPHLTIDGHEDATFSFIPVHLEYIMIELFKNSMRATVEFHRDSDKLPPVRVTLCKGDRDVTIRVSDQGGGIPYDIVNKVWQYAFTTALESMQSGLQGTSLISDAIARKIEPIAGIGFGLPQSKVYAEYFGGDLQLHTMHGYVRIFYIFLG